jgi:enoyl-CoA hydratase/carnithine racemase
MGYEQILYEVEDRVATITLNRPDKLNAWTSVMGREVRQAMEDAGADEGVRTVVLTGAGRGFCAGADMGLLSGISAGQASDAGRDVGRPAPSPAAAGGEFGGPYAYFPTIPKPIIAALNGATAGLGMVVALYCDLRYAAETAIFTTAFSRRGLIAEHGISWTLPRLVGLPAALDLLLSSRKVSAAEAARLGLVNHVLPDAELRAGVRAYARELADLVSPRSMRVIKRQLWEAQFQGLAEATALANEEMVQSFGCEDFKEGVAHFLEKRPPRFAGR